MKVVLILVLCLAFGYGMSQVQSDSTASHTVLRVQVDQKFLFAILRATESRNVEALERIVGRDNLEKMKKQIKEWDETKFHLNYISSWSLRQSNA